VIPSGSTQVSGLCEFTSPSGDGTWVERVQSVEPVNRVRLCLREKAIGHRR